MNTITTHVTRLSMSPHRTARSFRLWADQFVEIEAALHAGLHPTLNRIEPVRGVPTAQGLGSVVVRGRGRDLATLHGDYRRLE